MAGKQKTTKAASKSTGLTLGRKTKLNRYHGLALVAVVVATGIGFKLFSGASGKPSTYAVYQKYGCSTTIAKRPTLRQGSSGPCVRAAQEILQHAVGSVGANPRTAGQPKADGDFGPITKSYVVKFQTKKFKKAADRDGVIGPKTWAQLDRVTVSVQGCGSPGNPCGSTATPKASPITGCGGPGNPCGSTVTPKATPKVPVKCTSNSLACAQ